MMGLSTYIDAYREGVGLYISRTKLAPGNAAYGRDSGVSVRAGVRSDTSSLVPVATRLEGT